MPSKENIIILDSTLPEAEVQEAVQPPLSDFSKLPLELITQIFDNLHCWDVVSFMMANKECHAITQDVAHIIYDTGTGTVLPIINKYGFARLSDPRNKIVIQKALQACNFEGEGDNLSLATLKEKFQIVEDRNLVKLFLRYLHDYTPGAAIPYAKDHAEQAEFLKQNPGLSTCCITKVVDIPGAANAIRIWLQQAHSVNAWRLPLFQNCGGNYNHLHDKYMCIIPPEVGYFRTSKIEGSYNAFMLVSRNVVDALTLKINHFRYGVRICLSNNQLAVLPDEIAAIPFLHELWIDNNDEIMEGPRTTTS